MNFKWTAERDAEAIKILTDNASINKDRWYYRVREKLNLIEVVRRVQWKRSSTYYGSNREFHYIIIRDTHAASRHKGETKTHMKIMEHYSNITMAAVKAYIANCGRCVG
jgi:hypothetical protein